MVPDSIKRFFHNQINFDYKTVKHNIELYKHSSWYRFLWCVGLCFCSIILMNIAHTVYEGTYSLLWDGLFPSIMLPFLSILLINSLCTFDCHFRNTRVLKELDHNDDNKFPSDIRALYHIDTPNMISNTFHDHTMEAFAFENKEDNINNICSYCQHRNNVVNTILNNNISENRFNNIRFSIDRGNETEYNYNSYNRSVHHVKHVSKFNKFYVKFIKNPIAAIGDIIRIYFSQATIIYSYVEFSENLVHYVLLYHSSSNLMIKGVMYGSLSIGVIVSLGAVYILGSILSNLKNDRIFTSIFCKQKLI